MQDSAPPPWAITPEDIARDKGSILGPGYFAAQRFVSAMLADGERLEWAPIIEKAREDLYGRLLETVQDHLIYDVESNVQGYIRQMVDDTVRALLGGEPWALARYPLAAHYDGASLRRQILRNAGRELLALHDEYDQWGSRRVRPNNTVYEIERQACLTEVYREWNRRLTGRSPDPSGLPA